jgi:hypothetical protein
MCRAAHGGIRSTRDRRRRRLAQLFTFASATMTSWATAQYAYDPANADEQIPGIRYFGSAKDDKGSLLEGVTVQLSTARVDFVTVTDEQGRFRTVLPLEMVSALVTPKCFKVGFQSVRMIKRPGTGPKPTVQVDCVLHRTNSE